MKFNVCLIFIIISVIICSPPPIPEPDYEFIVNGSSLKQENQPSSPLKNLQEQSLLYVEKIEAVFNLNDEGRTEEYELRLSTKNLAPNSHFPNYKITKQLSNGNSLVVLSNTCYKVSNKNSSDVDCTSSFQNSTSQCSFNYDFKLYNDEYIVIKYKYKIIKVAQEILFKQEAITISKYEHGNSCHFKFIIPNEFTCLGLENNLLKKESSNVYSYNECPSEAIKDVIKFTPKRSQWRASVGNYLESSSDISKDITFTFPRYYRGGKNSIQDYNIITTENKSLKESNYIYNETNLRVTIQGNNQTKVGLEVNTTFSNILSNGFSVYTSEKFYKIDDDSIDSVIKAKTKEIINDENSEYKGYPNYYKIGKFVHSYITYDLAEHGKNYTVSEIFNLKKGVCEHYTILYNAMLNAIGIKTLKIFGWAFQKGEFSADQDTTGHAWTAALIDGKWKELDATWGLFEGIPSGHILKGFGKETVYYPNPSGIVTKYKKTEKIELFGLDSVSYENYAEEDKNNKGNNIKYPKILYFISLLYLLL